MIYTTQTNQTNTTNKSNVKLGNVPDANSYRRVGRRILKGGFTPENRRGGRFLCARTAEASATQGSPPKRRKLGRSELNRPDLRMHGRASLSHKCHPCYDHPELYQRMNRRLPAGLTVPIVLDRPVREMTRCADVVVTLNARTSALLEASMEGRPVTILDTCTVWFDHGLWGTDAWPTVHSVAELKRELDGMLADPSRCRVRVSQTGNAVHSILGYRESAASRCVDAMERLVEAALPPAGLRPAPCVTDPPWPHFAQPGRLDARNPFGPLEWSRPPAQRPIPDLAGVFSAGYTQDMTITVPDEVLRQAGLSERDALIEFACRLFDAERLDLFAASRLAGLSRTEMEAELRIRRIPIYRPTLEDIADEEAALKKFEA